MHSIEHSRAARTARLLAALLLAAPAFAAAQPQAAAPLLTPDEAEWQRLIEAGRRAANAGDAAAAEPLARRALEHARARFGAEHGNTIVALADLGVYLRQLGRLGEAEPLLAEAHALAERRAGPEHPVTLDIANSLAVLRENQGRYADAAALHARILAVRERQDATGAETLASMNNLGLAYIQLQRNAEADALLTRGLAIAEAALGPDHQTTLSLLVNLGLNHENEGRYEAAEAGYRRALERRTRSVGADHPGTLMVMNNVATVAARRGHHRQAEETFLAAIEAAERRFARDHPLVLMLLFNLASSYEQQGRLAEAEPLMLRVAEARERSLGPAHPDTLHALNARGVLLARRQRLDEAEPLLRRALDGRLAQFGDGHADTISSLNNLADLAMDRGRLAEADGLFARALAAAERALGVEHPETVRIVTNLAGLRRRERRFAEAETLYARAIAANRHIVGENHEQTSRAAANLALTRLASDPPAALAPARQAVTGWQARRAAALDDRFTEEEAEREQLEGHDVNLLLAEAAWAAGPDDAALAAEAFAALQEAMGGSADRAVVRMGVRRLAGEAGAGLAELVRERDAASDAWEVNRRDLTAALAGDGDEADALARQLEQERAALDARMAELDDRLRRDFPDYFALVRPEAVSVAAAQAMLAPDDALLLVAPTAGGTHVMALTRDGLAWRRSAWTQAQVDAAVRRLLWDVGADVDVPPADAQRWTAEDDEGYPFDRGTAHALYGEIVAPVAAALAGKRHVFIATDGSLTSLPFALLVAAPPQGEDGDPAALRTTRWFADAHALVHIPSVQSLHYLRRIADDSSSGGFVGFGDPLLLGQGAQRGGGRTRGPVLRNAISAGDLRQLRQLARLPGTAVELRNMRAALDAPPDSVHLAEAATEARLRTMDLAGARILALATHGLLAGELAGIGEPGLVLTPPAAPSEADDGFLAASEIAALRLDADWVILSACNTAAGDASDGATGLSGLARAFFHAGARTLLASHWPVRDDVSSRLTVRTLEIERDRPELSRAEAFQRAMREIRDDASRDTADDTWAHPNAWAPFTIIGDDGR